MYLSVAGVQPVKHHKKGPFKISGSCSTGSPTLMNTVSITNSVALVLKSFLFFPLHWQYDIYLSGRAEKLVNANGRVEMGCLRTRIFIVLS